MEGGVDLGVCELEWLGPERAGEIAGLARSILFGVYTDFPREDVESYIERNQSPEAVRAQMAGGMRYALVHRGGEVAGYTAFGLRDGTMMLGKLYLREGFRRMGLGSAIMGYAESDAKSRGYGRMLLEVDSNNAPARSLYESRGYRPVDGSDARGLMVMAKTLRPRTGRPGRWVHQQTYLCRRRRKGR